MAKKPGQSRAYQLANKFSVYLLILLFKNKIIEKDMVKDRDFFRFMIKVLSKHFSVETVFSRADFVSTRLLNNELEGVINNLDEDEEVRQVFLDVFKFTGRSYGLLLQNFQILKNNSSPRDTGDLFIPDQEINMMWFNVSGLDEKLVALCKDIARTAEEVAKKI